MGVMGSTVWLASKRLASAKAVDWVAMLKGGCRQFRHQGERHFSLFPQATAQRWQEQVLAEHVDSIHGGQSGEVAEVLEPSGPTMETSAQQSSCGDQKGLP